MESCHLACGQPSDQGRLKEEVSLQFIKSYTLLLVGLIVCEQLYALSRHDTLRNTCSNKRTASTHSGMTCQPSCSVYLTLLFCTARVVSLHVFFLQGVLYLIYRPISICLKNQYTSSFSIVKPTTSIS